MNFIAKTLSSLTGQLIPYNKGDFVLKLENIWEIYDGTSKNDNSPVSIFQFDKQHTSFYKFALNGSRKQSIIKFPGVVKVVEMIENDTMLYMITERVKPLKQFVDSNDSKILGVYNVAKTLKFINQDAQTVHGKVNIDSIFVTQSGEWKLGGFEIATNLNDLDKNLLLQGGSLPTFNSNIGPPEVNAKLDVLTRGKSGFKFDSFKFGCLILQVYNDNEPIVDVSMVNNFLKNIPRSLQGGVKKLLSDSITTRATVDLFVRKGEDSFFQIESIQNYNDLQELDFKSTELEKLEIFDKMIQTLKSYPIGFAEYRLLPLMIQFYQFNELQLQQLELISRILLHILQMEKTIKLDSTKFNKLIKPIIFNCFTKPDRAIRMILLNSLPSFIERLDKNEINNTIFQNLVTGFHDTNLAIREETLKSVIVIAEYLTDRQLNNELLRYLAKLQNDESETIRTNVVICLSKIAHLMNKNSRLTILITAFNKSIKDPFLPTRLSTLVAFGSCIDLFTPDIIASRILSSILPSLLDKSFKVRQEASKIFQLFLEIIHKELAKLPLDMDDDEQSTDVTNLGNKLSDTTLGWGNLNRFATPPVEDENSTFKWDHHNNNNKPNAQPSVEEYEFKEEDEEEIDELIQDMDDGWGEVNDEGEEEEDDEQFTFSKPVLHTTSKPKQPITTTRLNGNNNGNGNGKPTTRSNIGLKLQSKPKTSKLKLDLKLDQDDSGWGDGWD